MNWPGWLTNEERRSAFAEFASSIGVARRDVREATTASDGGWRSATTILEFRNVSAATHTLGFVARAHKAGKRLLVQGKVVQIAKMLTEMEEDRDEIVLLITKAAGEIHQQERTPRARHDWTADLCVIWIGEAAVAKAKLYEQMVVAVLGERLFFGNV